VVIIITLYSVLQRFNENSSIRCIKSMRLPNRENGKPTTSWYKVNPRRRSYRTREEGRRVEAVPALCASTESGIEKKREIERSKRKREGGMCIHSPFTVQVLRRVQLHRRARTTHRTADSWPCRKAQREVGDSQVSRYSGIQNGCRLNSGGR